MFVFLIFLFLPGRSVVSFSKFLCVATSWCGPVERFVPVIIF